MVAFPLRFRIGLLVILSSFVVVTGILNLKDRFTWEAPWDGVLWRETSEGLQVHSIDPTGPTSQTGLHTKDTLVSINGKSISNLRDYTAYIYQLGIGAPATYLVKEARTGQLISGPVELGSKVELSLTDLFRVFVAFGYLVIGSYILLHARASGAIHFYLLCLISFVLYLFRYTTKLDSLDYLVYWSSSIAFLLLPAVFLHFCLTFPVRKQLFKRQDAWHYALYLPFIVLFIAQASWFTGRLAFLGLPRTLHVRVLLDQIGILYYSVFVVLGVISLLHTFKTTADYAHKQQIKWIAYGSATAVFPFVLLYSLPYLAWEKSLAPIVEAALLPLVFIPLSFAYAIMKYKLLDVDIIFKNRTAYFMASSSILCIYFLLIVIGGKIGEFVAPEAGFISVSISALIAAFLFTPIRNKIQGLIDKYFYKDHYDYRKSLIDFGKTLSSEISLARVSRLILERIGRTFDVSKAALFLREDTPSGELAVIDSVGVCLVDPRMRLEDAEKMGLNAIQPLRAHGREIGFVALGKKGDGTGFTEEDRSLLEALSGYAAIAIENATLYRSVESKAYEYARLKDYSENIIESINVGVVAIDLKGLVTGCNSSFEQLYGVSRASIMGRSIEEVFSADFIHAIEEATGVEDWIFRETRNIYKLYLDTKRETNGTIVNLSIAPLVDPARRDQVNGTLIILDDISERVQLENQLLQAEKLSSIGLLAAGIAHEINTPIAGISSYTQMLLKQVHDSDPKKEVLAKIEKQTFRASEIIGSLLNFSRLNGSERKPVDLNHLIRETLSLLEHQFKNARITMNLDLSEEIPMAAGNSGKLQQVLINLFLNAKDAMPNGGQLRIQTSEADSMVVIDIIDTGAGISQEDLRKIYDPFFTTKGRKGTGLGLAVSYGIIQEHSGRIFVESQPGHGTHFRLKFPTAKK